MTPTETVDVNAIKTAAESRWREVLEHVGHIPRELLNQKHHLCPLCGGKDRFRLMNESTGAVFCNKCFSKGNGDGIAAVMHYRGIGFSEACQAIAEHLGLAHGDAKPQGDLMQQFCRLKRIQPDCIKQFGAKLATNDHVQQVIRVPQYGPDGTQCSHADYGTQEPLSKGLNAKGLPAGIYLPHDDNGKVRLPKSGECWLLVEGVKDAAALAELGYAAIGLPSCKMHQKFAPLFKGVNVAIIPDLDQAGIAGAEATERKLIAIAQNVGIARLPGEVKESKGDDVRDALRKQDGERVVRSTIDAVLDEMRPKPIELSVSFGPVVVRWMADMESGQRPVIYPTGLPLDLGPGAMIAIGGGPGSGKSTLGLQAICTALLNDSSLRAIIACVEMSPAQQFERLLAIESGVSYSAIRYRDEGFTDDLKERVQESCERLHDAIGDRLQFLTAPFTMDRIALAVQKHGSQIICLDYVQRIRPTESCQLQRREAIDATWSKARELCLDDLAVLVMSSLSRPAQKGSGYRGQDITAFKESGESEYAVDDAYLLDRDDEGVITLRCVKRRYDVPEDIELRQDRSLRFTPVQSEPVRIDVFDEFSMCEAF